MSIIGLGDSLMQDNFFDTFPQTGWFQMLKLFTAENVNLKNFAKNGCSTKSFIDQNRFSTALKQIQKRDIVLISFGHNDEKKEDPERYCSATGAYQDNLRYMIHCIKKKNAIPILLTSVPRCRYNPEGKLERTHAGYPSSMRQVAKDEKVYLIDLNEILARYANRVGSNKYRENFLIYPPNKYENYPRGITDTTHLNCDGAFRIAKEVVKQLSLIEDPNIYLCFRHNQKIQINNRLKLDRIKS